MKFFQMPAHALEVGHFVSLRQFKGLRSMIDVPDLRAVISVVQKDHLVKFVLSPGHEQHVMEEPGPILEVRADQMLKVVKVQSSEYRALKVHEEYDRDSTWRAAFITDRYAALDLYSYNLSAIRDALKYKPILRKLLEEVNLQNNFAVKINDQWGLLYEVEFHSNASEITQKRPAVLEKIYKKSLLLQQAFNRLVQLKRQFPNVHFCIPDESESIAERVAIWAFSPVGILSADEREALVLALNDVEKMSSNLAEIHA